MFLRKGKGYEQGWEPIKGSINFGETEEQAVIREIREEAGLQDKDIKILGKLPEFYWGESQEEKLKIKARVFVCEYIGGEIKLDKREHVNYKWMDVGEAMKEIWLKNGSKMIEEAYKLYLASKKQK